MVLGGQGARHGGERGYAMAALLVSIAVMSIVMATALPAWQHMMQREREAEYIFRAQQYARALMLFQRKYPGAYPTSVEILIKQRFLRKKYKDPLSPDGEFRVVRAGEMLPGQIPGAGPQGPGSPSGPSRFRRTGFGAGQSQTPQFGQGQQRGLGQPSIGLGASPFGRNDPRNPSGAQGDRNQPLKPGEQLDTSAKFIPGGMVGVASKNTGESIKIFKGQDHYDKWVVTIQDAMPQFRAPDQPGAQPGQPGVQPGANSPRPGQGSPPRGIGSRPDIGPSRPSTQPSRPGVGFPRRQ